MTNLARALRIAGLVLTSLFAGFGILFAAGYAFEDPGGWQGVLLFTSMVVPLMLLTWLARRHRVAALRWLVVGVVALLAYALAEVFVTVLDAPALPLGALVLSVPAAVLGLRDARQGGELLLLIAAAPVLSVLARTVHEGRGGPPLSAALGGSTGVVVVPLLVFAGMFLVASAVAPRQPGDATPGTSRRSPSGATR